MVGHAKESACKVDLCSCSAAHDVSYDSILTAIGAERIAPVIGQACERVSYDSLFTALVLSACTSVRLWDRTPRGDADRQTDRQTDRWIDRSIDRSFKLADHPLKKPPCQKGCGPLQRWPTFLTERVTLSRIPSEGPVQKETRKSVFGFPVSSYRTPLLFVCL